MSDFERNVWCLLGIPVDVVSLDQAVESLRNRIELGSACFFSTPNLNFIVSAVNDDFFRRSLIQSDLVFLDGMLPVWLARLIGIPDIVKVSGSNLFEAMRLGCPSAERPAIKVFFFGGAAGAAESACVALNRQHDMLHCVGYLNPGFGAVDDFGKPDIIERINASGADFVVVALGARKGQQWILANRTKLRAPLVAHLGAVINFTAGHVLRAPLWMQNCGLEWSWRIWQEPGLWRRYLGDSLALVPLMLRQILPSALAHRKIRQATIKPLDCAVTHDEGTTRIRLAGDCRIETIGPLRDVFCRAANGPNAIEIELNAVEVVDNAFLGLCLLLHKQSQLHNFKLSFSGLQRSTRNCFYRNGVGFLL